MKKIQVVTIQKPSGEQTLELGAKLLGENGKETDISVTNISVFFRTVTVSLSDGKEFVFRGFPFILVRK